MKMKKVLAIGLSAAMVMSVTPGEVFASDLDADVAVEEFSNDVDEDVLPEEPSVSESNTDFSDLSVEGVNSETPNSKNKSNTVENTIADNDFNDGNVQLSEVADKNPDFIDDMTSDAIGSNESQNITLNLNETKQITISRNIQDPGINFISSDSSIVSVSGNGYDFNTDSYPWSKDYYCTIKGAKNGTATISAMDANGETIKTYTVTVTTYNYSSCPGEEVTITISAYKDQNYIFSSDTTSISAKLTSYGSSSFNGFSTYWKKYQVAFENEGVHKITATGLVSNDTITYTVNVAHEWDNKYSVIYDSTCTQEGKEAIQCIKCKTAKSNSLRSIPAKGHTKVTDPALSPTCESTGKTEGSHCSVCGKVLVAQNVVKATGHVWDAGKITKEATCETSGVKTYTCTSCKATKTEDIKALGHKEVKDAAVAATCEKDGLTEGSHCSVCGKVLTEQKKLPATGHKVNSWKTISQATVFSPEQQTGSCSVCGKSENREVGSKLQKTMTVTATSLPLKTKQKTTVLRVSGLAAGDSIVSWESSNTKVAKVSGRSNGTSTITAGSKKGTAKITITLKSGLQKVVKVTVQKSAVKTKKITGVAKSLKLNKKQKAVLRPVIAPLTSKQKITYKSSNTKVASVNSKGQITAKKKGTAVITVKSGSKTAKCKVTVK